MKSTMKMLELPLYTVIRKTEDPKRCFVKKHPWEIETEVNDGPVLVEDSSDTPIWEPVHFSIGRTSVKVGMLFSSLENTIEYIKVHFPESDVMYYCLDNHEDLLDIMSYYDTHGIESFAINPPIEGGPMRVLRTDTGPTWVPSQ